MDAQDRADIGIVAARIVVAAGDQADLVHVVLGLVFHVPGIVQLVAARALLAGLPRRRHGVRRRRVLHRALARVVHVQRLQRLQARVLRVDVRLLVRRDGLFVAALHLEGEPLHRCRPERAADARALRRHRRAGVNRHALRALGTRAAGQVGERLPRFLCLLPRACLHGFAARRGETGGGVGSGHGASTLAAGRADVKRLADEAIYSNPSRTKTWFSGCPIRNTTARCGSAGVCYG
ncbi:hypothetical protein [Ramlibacter sp.]|uniref:hypothetical protein n=1 Tax=Ramlibacter sp. TaxID=1917967 RepID=UPI001793AC83|nr:hypothetical protein [Ramlibacter sp.]MBA2674701.1 hypothetical protein [Ramlibacter sp.]